MVLGLFLGRPLPAAAEEGLENGDLLVPFGPVLYAVDPESLRGRSLGRFSSPLSREYARWEGGGLFQIPRKNQLVFLDEDGGTETFEAPGPFLRGYFPQGAAVFLVDPRQAEDGGDAEGFLWRVYRREGRRIGELRGEFRLDLFPSDTVRRGDQLYAAGSTEDNRQNRVYRIDSRRAEFSLLHREPKKGGFLKLIDGGKLLAVYSSAGSLVPAEPQAGEEDSQAEVILFSLEGKGGEGLEGLDSRVEGRSWKPSLPGGWRFFGKGFAAENFLYIPVVDAGGKASLFRCSPQESGAAQLIDVPRAVYTPLAVLGEIVVYLGHNHFADRQEFSLVRLSSYSPYRAWERLFP